MEGQPYLTALVMVLDYTYVVGQDEKIEWVLIKDGECPQQNNNNDYGVYMLANIINTAVHCSVLPQQKNRWCLMHHITESSYLIALLVNECCTGYNYNL